jgi:hypothetical protein
MRFPMVSSGALSISAARERLKPEVTSPSDIVQPRFSFSIQYTLLVYMHHFKVIIHPFFIVNYGEMSISTARGRLRPEVTPPVDRATTVFYSCFVNNYRLSSTVSTLSALFLLPKMAIDVRLRPLGGVLYWK